MKPHQPGSGWTQTHVQQALNVLEGKEEPSYDAKAEDSGDGQG